MRFFQILASGAALIASALAQSSVVQINNYPQGGVVAGKQYTVTYSPADNVATTFILRKGSSGNLGTVGTLTSSATGGSFTWNVATDLVDGDDYALEIRRGDEFNYSAQFGLAEGSGQSSSAASSTSSTSSSESSASSSAGSSTTESSSGYATITSQSSLITSQSSVSGSIKPTSNHNGTVSTSKPTGTSQASIPESTGAAAILASSPLALVFGAVAAMMFLN